MVKQAGISLLEMFTVILIAFTLFQVLLEVYKQSLVAIHAISAMQSVEHNISLATVMLENDIKLAGYTGCLTQQQSIRGDASSLLIAHMSMPAERVSEKMHTATEVKLGKTIWIHTGDQVVISDCIHTEVATVNKVSVNPTYQRIGLAGALQYSYSQNASISQYQKHLYKLDSQKHQLYFLDNRNHKTVVASDVEDIKINYIKHGDDITGIEWMFHFKNGSFSQTVFQFIAL